MNLSGTTGDPVTTAVTIHGGNVSPSSTIFNNFTKTYTVSSDDASGIAAGSLIKNGTGMVTIDTTNTYTGATMINAGTLILTGTLNSTAITVAPGATFIDGLVGGSASITTSGATTLASANTYTGGTTLNAGTLNVNHASGLGTAALTINGGALDNTSGTAIAFSTNNNVQSWNGDFAFTGAGDGSHDLNMGTGNVTLGGSGTSRTVTVHAGILTVGKITGAAMGFTKAGNGTLQITPAVTIIITLP